MKRIPLGRSGIEVSQLCLGTMTFGSSTSEEVSHQQLDACLDVGLDFLDTAEAYPVPMNADWAGRSEEIIGNWLSKRGRRDDVVVATKIAGSGNSHIRNGEAISGAALRACCEASLKRLQTDYIDLYQLHWPNRGSYMFRQNWKYDPSSQDRAETLAHMADVAKVAAELMAEGKIRSFGLSNESAWGTAKWLEVAKQVGGPRVASVQNEYSLLCRLYDTDMAELGHNEDVTLLAFSPLACGYLSGKYQGGAIPEGSRITVMPEMGGRTGPNVQPAVQAYLDIAQKHGLDPVHMSLAWCCQRPFPVSPIFGATTQEQLLHILKGRDLVLEPDVMAEIDDAHRAHPMPY